MLHDIIVYYGQGRGKNVHGFVDRMTRSTATRLNGSLSSIKVKAIARINVHKPIDKLPGNMI